MRLFRTLLITQMLWVYLCNGMAGLIIFSKDRPLQLQALLESVELHIKGVHEVAVLCASSSTQFTNAYHTLARKFPDVHWVYQDPTQQRADFNSLLRNIVSHMSSSYIMFAVDDIIVIDAVDITECIDILQHTQAYGCYLRLGKDTNYCYAYQSPMRIPALQHVNREFYSWHIHGADKCWGYAHTVDMTLYPRRTVEEAVHMFGYSSPNLFESYWSSKQIPAAAMGICYTTSRIINIPLNLVQKDFIHNNCAHRYSVGDLLNLFLQEWRIDVEALYKLPHNSPHVDIDIPLKKTILPEITSPC